MEKVKDWKYIDVVYDVLLNWWVKFAEFTPNLVAAILVFLFFTYSSKFLSRATYNLFHRFFPKSRNRDTVMNIIGVFRFLIILAAAYISLEIMGLSGFFLKFIGSLGVAGVIAGVALKDLVSSIFSGMLVSVDKAFRVGDYVTINNISGTVQEIGFLTTKVINDEGKRVSIPNQLIFSAPFVNVSASQQRTVIIDFEIPNTENLEKASEVLLSQIKKASFVNYPETAEVIIVQQRLGVYSVQVKFTMIPGNNILRVRSEAILTLKQSLDEAGIDTSLPAQISN